MNRNTRKYAIPAFAFVLALAACGGAAERWVKPGVTEEAIAEDINECKFQAFAFSQAEWAMTDMTYIGVLGSPIHEPSSESLRYLHQGDQFANCMADREYRRAVN